MCFVLIRGWSKYAKQNKILKLEYCENSSSAICAFFWYSVLLKTDVWALKRTSRRKKNYFAIFEKTEAVSITFTQGKIPGIIDFSTRNAPDRSERDSVWIHWIAMNPLDR